jgi:hypothetical protein
MVPMSFTPPPLELGHVEKASEATPSGFAFAAVIAEGGVVGITAERARRALLGAWQT